MKISPAKLRKTHRTLALIFSVAALLSSGSGVLHSVMSRTQAPPPKAQPAGELAVEKIRVGTQEALAALPASHGKIKAVSIRTISGGPWYQFLAEGKPETFYVNAETGAWAENQDEAYASEIASANLGGAAVRKTDYLTEFNGEYLNIFRILPVYRYDAKDGRGTRVYVSTMTGSVTRSTDNQKQFEAAVFSNLHKLMFIKNKDARDLVLTLMTLGVFITALTGIGLFFLTRKRQS